MRTPSLIWLAVSLACCAPPPSYVSGEVVEVPEHRWGSAPDDPRAGWGPVDTAPEDTAPPSLINDAAPSPHITDGPATARGAWTPITVFAVRHAEKGTGSDPGLTEEGLARAEALALRLTDEPLTAVYATTLQRTQLTAQPTADAHGLVVNIDYEPEDELAEHILRHHRGEAVLHAGHSYTLPDFMDAIGVEPGDAYVSGYGQLFVIRIDHLDRVVVTEERFGD